MKTKTVLLIFILFAAGCTGGALKIHDWQDLPSAQYSIPPFAEKLSRYRIALDPGHGGLAHKTDYKRGATGKREAEMNLNVARHLKYFLERAGARVFLTRESDVFVSLKERAERAAESGSDFMVSLHHNLSPDESTNYVSVYYHIHPDISPVGIDLARHVYFGLVEALRLPQINDIGLLTDKSIYPSGFGVLRRSTIPAILLESSFYSNRKEEKRLMKRSYNQREAYAIFLGLARWAAGGVPNAQLIAPLTVSKNKKPTLRFKIDAGFASLSEDTTGILPIFSRSVMAKMDGRNFTGRIEMTHDEVALTPDTTLANGTHTVSLTLQNLFKNHNFPRLDSFTIAAPTDSIRFVAPAARISADTQVILPIKLQLFDADTLPVWDGTTLSVKADRGTISPKNPQLDNGEALVYYRAEQDTGLVRITALTEGHRADFYLELAAKGKKWALSGAAVDKSNGSAIPFATVSLGDSNTITADKNGSFFIANPRAGQTSFTINKTGYAPFMKPIRIDTSQSTIIIAEMEANLGGILHGEPFIIDAASPDSGSIRAQQLAQSLADTLIWAGAKPILIRNSAGRQSVEEKIETINQLPDGLYIKLKYHRIETDSTHILATIYPGNQAGEEFGRAVGSAFQKQQNVSFKLWQNTSVPEVTLTNKTAIEIIISSTHPRRSSGDTTALLDAIAAWQAQRTNLQGNN